MGIIQGILFGLVVLLNTKYSSKTNSYLAYTVFSLSFSNLQYWFYDCGLHKIFPFLDWLRIPCEFLIIPMFYIFVNKYLGSKITIRIKYTLLTPFLIDLIFQVILSTNLHTLERKILSENLIHNYLTIEEFSSFIYSTFLIILTLKIVNKYEYENLTFNLKKVIAKTKWIKKILFIGLIACVFWLIEIYYMKDNIHKGTSIYYPLWISISVIIYWLSYIGLFHSSIFSQRKKIRKEIVSNTLLKNKKKLSSSSQELFFKDFEDIIQKLYLDPNLSLEKVANQLGVSSNYLSQIINYREIRFNDYVNSIRIEKAKNMLNDESFANYTITSIGLEAGFNSNASFYRAFKKNTNISPSDFRKKIK